jgi:hypothetical protein
MRQKKITAEEQNNVKDTYPEYVDLKKGQLKSLTQSQIL